MDDAGVVAGLARCPPRRRRRPRRRAARDGARAARARWPGRRCPPRRWRGRSAPRAARVVARSGARGRSLVCRAGARHRSQRRHRRRARPPPGAGRPRRARLRPRPRARHRARASREVVRGDAVTGRRASTRRSTASTSPTSSSTRWRRRSTAPASFADRDRARRASASPTRRARAGVRRVVYLGGLVPADAPASPHLASRLEVEEALLDAAPEAVALRASIVVSAPLALVPLPRAPRRARAGHAAAGLARPPHAADRRARRDRLPRARGHERRRRRPAVARHRRPRRRDLRASSSSASATPAARAPARCDLPVHA